MSAQWGSTTPVRYPNQEWDAETARQLDAYVALTIVDVEGRQIELGDEAVLPLHRFGGTIIVQVFTKEGKGEADALPLVDQVRTIFQRARFQLGNSGWIRCRTTSAARVGVSDGWYQVNATTPFIRDVRQ